MFQDKPPAVCLLVFACLSIVNVLVYTSASLELMCVSVCVCVSAESKLLFIHAYLRVWSTFQLSLLIIAKGDDDDDDDVASSPLVSANICTLSSPSFSQCCVCVCRFIRSPITI